MNSIILPHSPLFRPPLLHPQSNNNDHLWLSSSSSSTASSSPSRSISTSIISSSHYHRLSSIAAAAAAATGPSNEGAISLGDFVEKDWSFLDTNSDANRIISAGEIEESSRVLVWIGSQGFVEQLVDSSPPLQLLLVVHDSLLVLASIKEKYDTVKCWQGELIYVPHKWAPFDVFFLYFLPALPFQLHLLFQSLAKHCLPGARIVMSHPQGREVAEKQRQQFPEVVISDLPDEMTLQKVAADHSFQMTEFVDEPALYLAVFKFKEEEQEEEDDSVKQTNKSQT
ncbi:hypothetical protein CsSME_00042503 [Camellia sinensis var. sinensis]